MSRSILTRGVETESGPFTYTALEQLRARVIAMEQVISRLSAENRILVSSGVLPYVDDESDLSFPEGTPQFAVVKKSGQDQLLVWMRVGVSTWGYQWVAGSVES